MTNNEKIVTCCQTNNTFSTLKIRDA